MPFPLHGMHHASRLLLQDEDEPPTLQDALDTGTNLTNALDTQLLLTSGYMVFFMQCGFAMLSAGSVRAKNAKNIVLKNLLDACFGAIGWYATGFAFAFGDGTGNGFISHSNFFLSALPFNNENSMRNDNDQDRGERLGFWFFQYAFTATAATIVSGAVAERCKFEAYLGYATFLSMWVYPVIVHWVWSDQGWISAFKDKPLFDVGAYDFAGCGVVHMTGGIAALAAAWVLGPRLGRFNAKGEALDMPGHNTNLALLGVFILWYGWFGFNPGSALTLSGSGYQIAANCAVTTTISAASATISTLVLSMLMEYAKSKHVVWDLVTTSNGTLGGLVAITSACAVVHPWQAVLIGLIGGVVYVFSSMFVLNVLKIDDPLDAIAVHGFCGMWGLLAAGIFPSNTLVEASYDLDTYNRGKVLGANIILLIVVCVWVLGWMVPFFLAMKVAGLFRVSPEEEHEGLDSSHHGGSAYPDDVTKAEAGGGVNSIMAEKINRLELQVREMQAAIRSSAPVKA